MIHGTGDDMPTFPFSTRFDLTEMVMMKWDTGQGRNGSARLR